MLQYVTWNEQLLAPRAPNTLRLLCLWKYPTIFNWLYIYNSTVYGGLNGWGRLLMRATLAMERCWGRLVSGAVQRFQTLCLKHAYPFSCRWTCPTNPPLEPLFLTTKNFTIPSKSHSGTRAVKTSRWLPGAMCFFCSLYSGAELPLILHFCLIQSTVQARPRKTDMCGWDSTFWIITVVAFAWRYTPVCSHIQCHVSCWNCRKNLFWISLHPRAYTQTHLTLRLQQ